ncbi:MULTISPECIES: TrkH family potassium uptake protein [unclassified Facklamia]|uniref:TrkH family potassium uptake protein n=1 Tax=Aerococcaceae TaxID=186827 RepID=UPI0013B8C95F|nr:MULTISPECIES: TrkH family potassium uptake protein [unclassified Facklamia]NEW64937.1 TrkH family potassium uptake protein [Facklamia sp. 252]NEW68398.1 TrkH family potassium uptake protein [Facklamia sp. 253]
MKRTIVAYLLGKILLVESLLLLLPVIVGLIYREPIEQISSYLFVSALLGGFAFLAGKLNPKKIKLYSRDGMVIVALGWIALSFFGALPLVLTKEIPNIFDAFFEISSGFTTTGSSILPTLSPLKHSSLFWRSFTHFVGGMGFLVFTLAVLPNTSEYIQLMRAEVPGPTFGKLVAKLSGTARILYGLYIIMTAILVMILVIVKVPVFDAFLLAFGTAGTGGFAINDQGFSIYQNQQLVEWIIAIGMLLFGINFNIYYLSILGYFKEIIKNDEELKFYLLIVITATTLITVNIIHYYDNFSQLIREVFFTVSSIITTTGYSVNDFTKWPIFSQTILVLLMFIGGCAGSTAGGIKVIRIIIYIKESIAEIKKSAQSGRVVVPKISEKPLRKSIESQVSHYLMVYIAIFIIILLSVSIEVDDFTTAFTAVAATFNNIGPGLSKVGPMENFSIFSNWNKFVLSIGMIAGRLEIYPMIILFSPTTIRKLIES